MILIPAEELRLYIVASQSVHLLYYYDTFVPGNDEVKQAFHPKYYLQNLNSLSNENCFILRHTCKSASTRSMFQKYKNLKNPMRFIVLATWSDIIPGQTK